jgi:hypothetical protein
MELLSNEGITGDVALKLYKEIETNFLRVMDEEGVKDETEFKKIVLLRTHQIIVQQIKSELTDERILSNMESLFVQNKEIVNMMRPLPPIIMAAGEEGLNRIRNAVELGSNIVLSYPVSSDKPLFSKLQRDVEKNIVPLGLVSSDLNGIGQKESTFEILKRISSKVKQKYGRQVSEAILLGGQLGYLGQAGYILRKSLGTQEHDLMMDRLKLVGLDNEVLGAIEKFWTAFTSNLDVQEDSQTFFVILEDYLIRFGFNDSCQDRMRRFMLNAYDLVADGSFKSKALKASEGSGNR